MATKPITRESLLATFRNLSVPMVVTFYHVATPDMRKKENPYLEAKRHATVRGLINFTYEGIVNEGMPDGYKDFKAGPRVWGHRIHGCPLVEHKGEFYLETLPMQKADVTYWDVHGNLIHPDSIKPFLKKPEDIPLDMPRPKDYRVSGIQWIDLEDQRYSII